MRLPCAERCCAGFGRGTSPEQALDRGRTPGPVAFVWIGPEAIHESAFEEPAATVRP